MSWLVIVTLIALLHLFQNGAHIADRELWHDEAATYSLAAQGLSATLTSAVTIHAQPPLYYLILHFLVAISSVEWFIRGFSWLCILGLLGFILFGVEELSRLARVFFCTILVFHDFTHYLSQELRPYALSALTTFVATVLFMRLVRRPARSTAIGYGAVELISLYTLAFDVWPFVFHGLCLAIVVVRQSRSGWREALRRHSSALISVASVSLCYLPYPVVAWQLYNAVGNPTLGGALHWVADPGLYQNELHKLLFKGVPSLGMWFALVAVAIGVGVELQGGNPAVLLPAAIVVGQIMFAQGFIHRGAIVVSVRYYTPAFPLFWLLCALGFHHLVRSPPQLVWQVVLVALAGKASMRGIPFVQNARQPVPRAEWRQLHDALDALPGRKVVFLDPDWLGMLLEYEARNDPAIVVKEVKWRTWYPLEDHWLDREYIEKSIEEERGADCFAFYFVDSGGPGWWRSGPSSPYFSVFVPAMQRIGYKEVPLPGFAHGFCKQP